MNTRFLLIALCLLAVGCNSSSHKAVLSLNAPAPIGPYSQAIKAGKLLFLSGQIAINPKTGQMENDDIETETRRVLENLKAVLQAEGLGLEHVVQSTIYLSNIADFEAVNKVYANYFTSTTAPARATVQVAALPKEARIEISGIAVRKR
jgi:2-iminobutanoate/2-iminopropanoate deaminase